MDAQRFDERETIVTCQEQRRAIDGHLRFLEWLGKPLQPGARVLDFGCGIGQAVEILLDMGYDVHGVDVVDWWRRDDYWDKSYLPQARVTERLRCMDESNYRIPFPDGHFEFCFSDQVMEHVGDHALVFGEIMRVLKSDAVSVHRFPGPNMLMEGHLFVPFPVLCYYKPYLAMWAILGRRSPDQRALTWRQTLASNVEFMGKVNYPRKTRLRRYAAKAGVEIAFLEKQELLLRDFGNAGRLVSRAGRLGLDRLLAGVLAPFAQRYMVLARRALGPGDAGGSGDRCNARATQSNRARGHFWQDKAKMSKRGVLLRSWLACSSLLKGATGCGGLGSHIGVKERS
jgi:SAM-dependent methyltransferase